MQISMNLDCWYWIELNSVRWNELPAVRLLEKTSEIKYTSILSRRLLNHVRRKEGWFWFGSIRSSSRIEARRSFELLICWHWAAVANMILTVSVNEKSSGKSFSLLPLIIFAVSSDYRLHRKQICTKFEYDLSATDQSWLRTFPSYFGFVRTCHIFCT